MKHLMKYLIAAVILAPALAVAGVTIHFKGSVPTKTQAGLVLEKAEAYAKQQSWRIEPGENALVIYTHEWCEPVHIKFDELELVSEFTKTQFAGPIVHIEIINLFRLLEPLFSKLVIHDEGEYWETGNLEKLTANIEQVNTMIAAITQQRTDVVGPKKLPDGKIIDLIQHP